MELENKELLIRNITFDGNRLMISINGKKGSVVLSKYFNMDTTWSFDYHGRNPRYEGQTPQDYNCEFLNNECGCYCDGRGLSKEVSRQMTESLAKDSFLIWTFLEEHYDLLI